MKFLVEITQTLTGWVAVEADSRLLAIHRANEVFNGQGHELPDMDDVHDLEFTSHNFGEYDEMPQMVIE